MSVITSVHVFFQNGATLGEMRAFVTAAERIGTKDSEDVVNVNSNGDIIGLEAVGAASFDPDGNGS